MNRALERRLKDLNGADFSAVQLTPPGSAASLTFGQGVTDAKPGSFRGGLIVKDILAAHEDIVASGIEATEQVVIAIQSAWHQHQDSDAAFETVAMIRAAVRALRPDPAS